MFAPIYRCPTAFNMLLHIAAPPLTSAPLPSLQPPSLTLFSLPFFGFLAFPAHSHRVSYPPPPVQGRASSPSPKAQFPPTEKGRDPSWAGGGGAGSRASQQPFSQHPSPVKSIVALGVKAEHDPWGGGFTRLKSLPHWPLGLLCPSFCPAPAPLLCLPCSLLPSCHPMHRPPRTPTPQATRVKLSSNQEEKTVPCPQEASGLSLDEIHIYSMAVRSARHQLMEE